MTAREHQDTPALAWPPTGGTLVKRYQRFLADGVLDGGLTVAAHCLNTGSMIFYFVQRMDARCFRPADHIDAA